MSFAFQVTEDDFDLVLVRFNSTLSVARRAEAWSSIDIQAVETAALSVDYSEGEDDESILSRQTDAAHQDITRQLIQNGFFDTFDLI